MPKENWRKNASISYFRKDHFLAVDHGATNTFKQRALYWNPLILTCKWCRARLCHIPLDFQKCRAINSSACIRPPPKEHLCSSSYYLKFSHDTAQGSDLNYKSLRFFKGFELAWNLVQKSVCKALLRMLFFLLFLACTCPTYRRLNQSKKFPKEVKEQQLQFHEQEYTHRRQHSWFRI